MNSIEEKDNKILKDKKVKTFNRIIKNNGLNDCYSNSCQIRIKGKK